MNPIISSINQIYRSLFSRSFWLRIRILLRYCYRRLSEERLPNVAGTMTYTAILGLVPILILLSILPQFEILRSVLEVYFERAMVPGHFSNTIFHYLKSFTSSAPNISAVGIIFLLISTVMTINMVEGAFNKIWDVWEPRPLPLRILLYLIIAILGPIVLGVSLTLTYHLFLVANNLADQLPYQGTISFTVLLTAWTTITFTFLYRVVPYRLVEWKDAFWGALFAAIALLIAKRGFAIFIIHFASYETIYGSLAAIPIFLVWMYISSLIILTGAVLASAMPDFRANRWRKPSTAGTEFIDAIRLIYILSHEKEASEMKTKSQYVETLIHVGAHRLEKMLQKMQEAGWIELNMSSFRWRKRPIKQTIEEWKWVSDLSQLTLASVYHLFIYKIKGPEELVRKINAAIDNNLQQTLADYFDEMTEGEQKLLLLQPK